MTVLAVDEAAGGCVVGGGGAGVLPAARFSLEVRRLRRGPGLRATNLRILPEKPLKNYDIPRSHHTHTTQHLP